MALHLVRPKYRSITNPSLVHLFSTSSSDPPPQGNAVSDADSSQSSSQSSLFNDVKASLKQDPPQPPKQPISPFAKRVENPSSFADKTTAKKAVSFEEIRKSLSDFRQRSPRTSHTGSNFGPSKSESLFSFEELYRNKVSAKSDNPGGNNTNFEPSKGENLHFNTIRNSLRQMGSNSGMNMDRKGQSLSLSDLKDTLRLKPNAMGNMSSKVIGGSQALPLSVFGKEMQATEEGGGKESRDTMKTEFVKMYSYEELGEKLRKLRPEQKQTEAGEGLFSMQELNERLVKLREMEEKERQGHIGGTEKDIRQCLLTLKMFEETKKNSFHRVEVLSQLGVTPEYMLHPPKEHLIETYFHPDNMSSGEKMKIELAKVREDFKMSESDCGSARVQVAQLTTKIKHLTSALHKKDKHSRKGLIGMVQRRKKLLKYLRRTDWDSYCLVLSRLGLRDNPDYKH